MEDRFNFRIPVFTDKDTFIEFEYIELGDSIDEPLAGRIGEPQQCTGLKDKNGRLICEGDIVKIKCVSPWGKELEAIGYVYYDRCAYWINFKHHSSELYCEYAIYEVLGNIYENPELLEANND